nr:helix-turn-helix domain-containing protein [Kineococcus siccus]
MRDLVRREDLGLRPLTGAAQGSTATVRRGYVTDLPDPGRYLRAGDLVLTSGQWFRDEDAAACCERFVAGVAGAGGVGVVVGVLTLGRVPPELLAACDRQGLPLLLIAQDRSFVAVCEVVMHRALAERGLAVARTLGLHRDLVEAVSRGRGVVGVLELLHAETAAEGLVLLPTGEVAGGVGRAADLPGTVRQNLWRAALRASGPLLVQRVDVGEAGWAPTWTMWRLRGAGDRTPGHLFLAGDHREDSHREDGHREDGRGPEPRPAGPGLAVLDAVEAALGVLGLELELADAQRDAEQRRVAELVALLTADSAGAGELAAHQRLLGADPRQPTAVVVGTLSGSGVPDQVALRVLSEALTGEGRSVAGCVRAGAAVLLVNGPGAADDAVVAAVRGVADRSAPLLREHRLLVGVGGPARAPGELTVALDTARQRHRAAGAGAGPVVVVSGQDVQTHELLMAALPAALRDSYADRVLGPLEAYDAAHSSRLVQTVEVFLDAAGSWQRAAEVLHVHVNTLRYRVQRVEELTGRDLTTVADRTDLFLALVLRRRWDAGGG